MRPPTAYWFGASHPRYGMKTWLYAATTIPPTRPLPSKKGWMVSKSVYHFTSESTFWTIRR